MDTPNRLDVPRAEGGLFLFTDWLSSRTIAALAKNLALNCVTRIALRLRAAAFRPN